MRIIGGSLRGRRIRAPRGRHTRPTTDRVREAIFNILGDVPCGVHVLDLYAGSGALGFEALSRGADCVTFVERAPDACRTIAGNAAGLGVQERIRIEQGDVHTFLGESAGSSRFSLVFADPPYGGGFPLRTLGQLCEWDGLADPAIVVLEIARAVAANLEESGLPDENLALMRKRNYSETTVLVFRWRSRRENECGTQGDVPREF